MSNQTTAVLIGTPETLSDLSRQLGTLADGPRVVGYVLAEGESTRGGFDTLETLPRLCGTLRPTLAIVSMPADRLGTTLRVRATLAGLGVPERFVPPLAELIGEVGAGGVGAGRRGSANLNWAELIGRTPHAIDRAQVQGLVTGRRVLITGAGGSIGSELARVVAGFAPSHLVLMERAENALFEVDRQIGERFARVSKKAVLHDVSNADATLRHLSSLKPDVVFHAAAHKHVPLMEDHPAHAVMNNLFGTKSIADAALATGVSRLVMISSDKAVNPTSVMGATKRLAEMYIQALHRQSVAISAAGTRFCMVRFGNVLGSACSVLPIWASQIDAGGPVTVTDERMTRYFMTINEAATLVIQAAAMPRDESSAAVYVLDMGEPLRILNLAQRFARSQGFEPVVGGGSRGAGGGPPTMEIRLTGARPGEKLHEELAYAREKLSETTHPGIRAWSEDAGGTFNLPRMISELSAVRESMDREVVLEAIRRHVPELAPAPGAELKPGRVSIDVPRVLAA